MSRLAFAAAAALLATPAIANAPPPHVVEAPASWDVAMEHDLTLVFGDYENPSISIACPEGLKQLRISATPAWSQADGAAVNGPTDKITLTLGDKSFEAVQDPEINNAMAYVLKADADSVTAVMMAKNAKIALASDPQQTREGTEDTGGAFDMFATTCAQINGLR